ncbi:hypothetical protein COLO4_01530 [Corchorus olitorius]|uniref:Uncharacterized protein n=1 Tax=Corchorus olitorius TaxID=93759 RepID=A0A1R3L2J3_9ROSI|nr:hypothetical protein COLO4_01530 [Corchorus olitorius]
MSPNASLKLPELNPPKPAPPPMLGSTPAWPYWS